MNSRRSSGHRGAALLMTAGLLSVVFCQFADARGFRGGGGRSAPMSVRQGGGMGGQGFRAGAAQRPAMGNAGNINRGNINRGNINRGNINRGNINRGNVNTGNINRGNINRGNINTGNINVDVDNGWNGNYGYRGYYDNDGAVAAAAITSAVVTAAVIGSVQTQIPPSCTTVVHANVTYQQCGSTWYMPQASGTSVQYVVVRPPY